MTKDYSSREIEATAVDTKTAATTLGEDTAPGALNVPSGATELEAVIVTIGCDHAAAGSAVGLLRLEGGGLPSGPYVVNFGAAGSESTTGASSLVKGQRIPLGVPVSPGNEVLISIEMAGEDIGSLHSGVTLVFKTGSVSGGKVTGIVTVEGDLADDGVAIPLTTQGSTTAPSRQVPAGSKVIDRLIVSVAPDLAAAGACSFLVRLGGKGIKGGEQHIFVAGAGGAAVQSGADPVGLAMSPFVLDDAEIEVVSLNTIDVEGEITGDDIGDAHMAVTMIFA